jgi:glycosyltransferase involved in cell wall biosynthesis
MARFPLYVASLLLRIPGCDVLHVFATSYWSFRLTTMPAILLGKTFGKEVIVNYHSGSATDYLSNSRAAVGALRLADALVVQSSFLAGVFDSFGLDTTVIPNHIDVASFRFRVRSPPRPRFLSTRALEPKYDVETILRAFALIQGQVASAELRIVGDGSRRNELEEIARTLDLRGVSFSGLVDPARIPDVYDASDVLLNASIVDSMPLSLLEAFAAGLPIVSTATGGIPDFVSHEQTGLLVPQRDPAAMAAGALRLVREPELAARVASNARAASANYAWPAVGPHWLALYKAARDRNHGGARRAPVRRRRARSAMRRPTS